MLMSRFARRPLLAGLVALVAVIGCGRPKYPVSGVVIYDDGSPYASGGVVAMETVIDGKIVMSRGGIAKDGRFVLASEKPDDGAFAGSYRVRVLPNIVIDGPPSVGIPEAMQSFETSGLTFEVGSGSNEFTIKLGTKPAR